MILLMNRLTGLLLATSLPVLVWADTAEAPLKAYVSIYGFAAKIKGNVGLGPLQQKLSVPFSDTWADLDGAYMAYIDVTKGRWAPT